MGGVGWVGLQTGWLGGKGLVGTDWVVRRGGVGWVRLGGYKGRSWLG